MAGGLLKQFDDYIRLVEQARFHMGPLTPDDFFNDLNSFSAGAFGVEVSDLWSPGRRWPEAQARQVCWSALRRRGLHYPTIARMYRRDHTTIVSGVHRFGAMMDHSRPFREKFGAVMTGLLKKGWLLADPEHEELLLVAAERFQ